MFWEFILDFGVRNDQSQQYYYESIFDWIYLRLKANTAV